MLPTAGKVADEMAELGGRKFNEPAGPFEVGPR